MNLGMRTDEKKRTEFAVDAAHVRMHVGGGHRPLLWHKLRRQSYCRSCSWRAFTIEKMLDIKPSHLMPRSVEAVA